MSSYLYYIKLTNKEENLVGYKVGTTTGSIEDRFESLISSKNKNSIIEVLSYEHMHDADRVEGAILNKYSKYLMGSSAKLLLKTSGNVIRSGYTEVFALDLRSIDSDFAKTASIGYKTPTQKAIMAYREYYSRHKAKGEKVGQAEVANQFGTTVKQLGRAGTLLKKAGEEIVEFLFQGNKINTGTEMDPNNTDSLASLINYFDKRGSTLLDLSNNSKVNEDFTVEEMEAINTALIDLKSQFGNRLLTRLNSMLFYSLKHSN